MRKISLIQHFKHKKSILIIIKLLICEFVRKYCNHWFCFSYVEWRLVSWVNFLWGNFRPSGEFLHLLTWMRVQTNTVRLFAQMRLLRLNNASNWNENSGQTFLFQDYINFYIRFCNYFSMDYCRYWAVFY